MTAIAPHAHEAEVAARFDLLHRRFKPEVGLSDVRLVHGRGHGVQRAIVQAALEQHSCVSEFWDDPKSHLGATIARLTPR